MEYRDAVINAAQALQRGEDANWQLAQLTYENTNRRGERNAGRVSHEQWSADVRAESGRRFSEGTSRKYAMVWEAQSSQKGTLSWTEAWYEEVGRDAPGPMRSRQTDIHLNEAPAERKAEIFQRLARDPEVMASAEVTATIVETVARNPELTARTVARAEERRPVSPIPPRQHVTPVSVAAMLGGGATAQVGARNAAERVSGLVSWIRANRETLRDGDTEAIREDIEDYRQAAEMYRRYAGEIELALGGQASDSWLRSVLNEV